MTYTKILVTSEGLFAISEDGKERLSIPQGAIEKNRALIDMDWAHNHGKTFDIPDGFQVTVERKKESCGHPCEKYQDICQYHGCDNVNSYALLTPHH